MKAFVRFFKCKSTKNAVVAPETTAHHPLQTFDTFDAARDGRLTRRQFKLAMLFLLGFPPHKFEVRRLYPLGDAASGANASILYLMQRICADMTRERFCAVAEAAVAGTDAHDELRQLFLAFDRCGRGRARCMHSMHLIGTGFITAEDFEAAAQEVRPRLLSTALRDAFREADGDGDGRIGFADFCRFMRT